MIGVKQGGHSSALERRAVVSFSRRRLHARPMTRIGEAAPGGLTAEAADSSFSDSLLDEEFDELGCELSVLLKVTLQL